MFLIVLFFFLGILINNKWGKFSFCELITEYRFFHHDPGMRFIKLFTGLLLISYNIYVIYYVSVYPISIFVWPAIILVHIIINSNFGMSLAHNMMHADLAADKLLASLLLTVNGFFYLEYDHLYIHHRHVATPGDPASAGKNTGLYKYLPFSIINRLKFIIKRRPKDQLERHYLIKVYILMIAAFMWLIFSAYLSIYSFIMVSMQYVAVILIYETVTYIQHYGLSRAKKDQYIYEKVNLSHSWNSYYRYSNYLYFFMPVHGMHHAAVEEMNIQQFAASPEMPLPFPQMLRLAYFPKKWFAVIDPLVEKYKTIN